MKDVNATGFQLLLGPDDWSAALASGGDGLVWEDARSSLALAPEGTRFPPRRGAARLTPEDRRGADRDRFGNWYWIDATRRAIRVWRPGQEASDYWSADSLDAAPCQPGDGSFADSAPAEPTYGDLRLSGLAVITRHYLLVGTLEPGGLLVFDLHAAGPPIFTLWPEALDIGVFDIARAGDGGAWILDRGGAGAPGRLWRLDDRLCLTPLDGVTALPQPAPSPFAPEGADPEPAQPSEIASGLDLTRPGPDGRPGATAPVAVADLGDGTALILDAAPGAPAQILRYGAGGPIGGATLDAARLAAFETPPDALSGHDIAILPDPDAPPGRIEGVVVLVDDQGDQALWLRFGAEAAAPDRPPGAEFDLALVPSFLPLRRFTGRGLVSAEGQVHYDIGDRWVPLAADPRQRRAAAGDLGPVRFDAGEPGTAWHRVMLDACIPPGTGLTVAMRAADAPGDLARLPFTDLPRPYRRGDGAEVPFWEPFPSADAPEGSGTWETLVQGATGRYLELRLAMTGDRRATPRLRALRLYAPRFSYLDRYLPALYREDPVSADFLDRFLANVEGLFTAMEDRVERAHGLFDTRKAPAEGLDWLAGWLGARLEPDWDDARRRLFIDHAELLFRWRGTPAGLKAVIDIATDPCPDASLLAGLASGTPPEPSAARRGVRLSEDHARRRITAPGPARDPALDGWEPADGAAPIHAAYARFALARRSATPATLAAAWGRARPFADKADIRFPALVPANPAEQEDWRAFTAGPLGLPYADAGPADAQAWRGFLARRYANPWRIARAHGVFGRDPRFLPSRLPHGGARLADWIDFVTGVLPVTRAAHRFVVLAPVTPDEDPATRDARLGRIAQIVTRERPAHTAFEVRPYWALFQAGTARLGIDTALSEGARFTAIELGRAALGEGYLGYGHPLSVTDRAVVGRDTAEEMRL